MVLGLVAEIRPRISDCLHFPFVLRSKFLITPGKSECEAELERPLHTLCNPLITNGG